MNLSIIIPLYNEEKLIKEVVKNINLVSFPDFLNRYEIIIVDDASTDNSNNVATNLSHEHSHVQLYTHQKNQGKGAAVRTGIKHSSGDVVLIQDANLELSPTDIPSLLLAMHELKIGFVNGSRYMHGVLRPLSSYKRYLANQFFTFLTSIIVNVKLTDMACGYKLVEKDLLNQISLKENRFGFEAEIILKALRVKKNNIVEIPVKYFPRNQGEGKKLNNLDGFKILWTIFKFGLLNMK